MVKKIAILLTCVLIFCLSSCANGESSPAQTGALTEDTQNAAENNTTQTQSESEPENMEQEDDNMRENVFYITVADSTFTANFSDNSGADAFEQLLAGGSVTIEMRDYSGFEKVGGLGESLPASHSRITTQAGDIMLYQEDQIVIFYGSNSYSYTPLGRVNDLTGWADALGSGDVTVTFSLTQP